MDKNIVLMGMMGSGKSTLGRALAKKLHKSFVDTDKEIEKAAFMSISEIVERDGEAFFRDREEKVIERILDTPNQVVALGGGSILSTLVRQQIKENCTSIWIKVHPDILCNRLSNSRKQRPLLQQDDLSIEDIIHKLLNEREQYYKQANIIVDTQSETDREIDEILTLMENALYEHE